MKPLKRKLKSEAGASLLLVLLFFMISILVMASVLMAAASNAGKTRSNKEEHQLYLALSCALQMVCDDLKGAEYCGQYECEVEDIYVTDPEDPTKEVYSHTEKSFQQLEGEVRDSEISALLVDDFDYIFGQQMEHDIDTLHRSDHYVSLSGIRGLTEPPKHTLTVTPEIDGLQDKEVAITLQVVKDSYSIELTAELEGYQIMAEVTANATQPGINTVPDVTDDYSSNSMTWKLGWITKHGRR